MPAPSSPANLAASMADDVPFLAMSCQGPQPVAESLHAIKRSGRPRKLSAQQDKQVMRLIDGKRPDHYGFGSGLWTRQIVQQLLLARFQVTLSLLSVSKLLRRLGLLPYCQPQHAGLVADMARPTGAEVLFWRANQVAPEAQLVSGFHTGEVYYLFLANVQGAFWFASCPGPMSSAKLPVLLGRLMRGRRRAVILVLDDCRADWTAAMGAYAATTHNRLSLHQMPAC